MAQPIISSRAPHFARPAFRAPRISRVASALLTLLILSSSAALAQTQSAEVLFFDDLNNGFSTGNWQQYGKNGFKDFIQDRTIWNPSPSSTGAIIVDRYQAPAIIRNFSALQLSTYAAGNSPGGNPRNPDRNTSPRNYLYGTEFQTTREFGPPALGQAIDFEACVDVSNLPKGAVAAMYPYGQDYNSSNDIITSDEADFEYLGTFAPNRFLATAWNNFQRYGRNGKEVDNTSYNNGNGQNRHFGLEKSLLKGQPPGIPLDRNAPNSFHCIKIRWLRTASGFSLEWYTRQLEEDTWLLVHQEQNVKPDRAMQLHFNIWVPASSFAIAFDESLSPAEYAQNNRNYYMYVDYAKVTRVSNVQSATGLSLTSPSTPVVSPPAGTELTNPSSAEPFKFNVSLTPYGPNTNTLLTATPYIYQPEKYDLTYRFSVNGYVVQYGTNPVLNLGTPGFGDHGDVISVAVFARNKTTDERGYATISATVVNTAPTANSVSASAQSGREIIIPLSGSDIDGDPLTFQRTAGPTNGTGGIFLDTDGQYKMRYTSRSNFAGVETVNFVSKDSLNRTSDAATITINVGSGGGA